MIQSITDQDAYSFYCQNYILHHHPTTNVRYTFINRRPTDLQNDDNADDFLDRLVEKIGEMQKFRFTRDERRFFENLDIFPADYLDYLNDYRFDISEVLVGYKNNQLFIKIEGPWHKTILWEVPLLALVSETNFELRDKYDATLLEQEKKMKAKAQNLSHLWVAEFGTRRRRSFQHQLIAVEQLRKYARGFAGTSNVHLARICGNLKVAGTISHQIWMGTSGIIGVENANQTVNENWINFYQGKLDTVVPDTFTSEFFFKSFDFKMSRLYSTLKQDSGSPYRFVDLALKHYEKMGIDPKTKSIIFSDSLDVEKCWDIYRAVQNRINVRFGVGTSFTNEVTNSPALQIVIKLTEIEVDGVWKPVVKLSDDPAKNSGDKSEIERVRKIISSKP